VTEDARAESKTPPQEDDRPEILQKLEERRERHQQRGRLHRAAIVALGILLVLGGIVLSGPGVPGPGFLVVLIGLSFLALEFDRAERLLEKVILWADAWTDRIERLPKWMKITGSVLGVLGLAAFIVAAILWDIPLLPF
jgi:Putative transmembrane protein (PGPGW)